MISEMFFTNIYIQIYICCIFYFPISLCIYDRIPVNINAAFFGRHTDNKNIWQSLENSGLWEI